MANNDLHKALHRRPGKPSKFHTVLAPAVLLAAFLLAVTAAIWIAVFDDPDGGRPVAVAQIEDAAPATTGSIGEAGVAVASVPSTAAPQPVGELAALPMAPGSAGQTGLIETSAFGPLPRVAPDGRRPLEVYARPAPPAVPGVPRIAIVIGGMGISQTGTRTAIQILPEDITLAFAPYGSSLQRWVDEARAEGHEVLLQVPLEPIGYPAENPGEHTLLVSNDSRASQQDLNWVLGRMTSYAGVMNYMGARFTSDDRAVASFLGEVGDRGLFYLDDGSSQQSRAGEVGAALHVPVLTADAIIDRNRAPQEIERELATLEAIARSRGVAIGVASAFPATVEAIASWTREAQARGVSIVPASAALEPRQ